MTEARLKRLAEKAHRARADNNLARILFRAGGSQG